MPIFEHLEQLRAFERRHLRFLQTLEDHDMVKAIGLYQARGKPLTLKQLSGLEIGSMATLQRRLARLKRLGVVVQRRSEVDRRNVELELGSRIQRMFQRYSALLVAKPAGNGADPSADGPIPFAEPVLRSLRERAGAAKPMK